MSRKNALRAGVWEAVQELKDCCRTLINPVVSAGSQVIQATFIAHHISIGIQAFIAQRVIERHQTYHEPVI